MVRIISEKNLCLTSTGFGKSVIIGDCKQNLTEWNIINGYIKDINGNCLVGSNFGKPVHVEGCNSNYKWNFVCSINNWCTIETKIEGKKLCLAFLNEHTSLLECTGSFISWNVLGMRLIGEEANANTDQTHDL